MSQFIYNIMADNVQKADDQNAEGVRDAFTQSNYTDRCIYLYIDGWEDALPRDS